MNDDEECIKVFSNNENEIIGVIFGAIRFTGEKCYFYMNKMKGIRVLEKRDSGQPAWTFNNCDFEIIDLSDVSLEIG